MDDQTGDGSCMGPVESHTNLLISSNSVKAQLMLAEPVLFLYGFSKSEQTERGPALLRGSLIIRVLKPTKIKAISLRFRGTSRTEWPEGIPPKKIETFESIEVYSHVWDFFSHQTSNADVGSGAHSVRLLDTENVIPTGQSEASIPSAASSVAGTEGRIPNFARSQTHSFESTVKGVLGRVRNASPSPALRPVTTQPTAQDSKGYRTFMPAEYIYNFELAIPQTALETTRCNFGHVRYVFELHIDRSGTFKSNLSGSRELTILRSLAMSNLEFSEPIVISRCWENLLQYDIVIAGKAFVIGGSIPVAFSLVPLAKVQCHRIRIYITEHTEYYCKRRKVRRVEPVHKFLLLEKVGPGGVRDSLLNQDATGQAISTLTAFEFDVKIPKVFKDLRDRLRPNANVTNIKVHHWIKVVLRLSRGTPDPKTGKTKYYEVSIDSPVTLLDHRTLSANTLPSYHDDGEETPVGLRPYQEFVESMPRRAIDYLRRPSDAPPPFDAEERPPNVYPPEYDQVHDSLQTYAQRFEEYQQVHGTGDSGNSSSDRDITPQPSDAPQFSQIIWRDDGDLGPNGVTPMAAAPQDEVDPLDGDLSVPHNIDSTAAPGGAPSSSIDLSSDFELPPSLSPTKHRGPVGRSSSVAGTSSQRIPADHSPRSNNYEMYPYAPLSPQTSALWNRSAGRRPSTTSTISHGSPSIGGSRPSLVRSYSSVTQGSHAHAASVDSARNSVAPSTRYYRQSSFISVDLADQLMRSRRPSRVSTLSEVQDVTNWYSDSRNTSQSSLGVSVYEYEGPDGSPLLGPESMSEPGDRTDWDFEDDVASVYSQSSFALTAPAFNG